MPSDTGDLPIHPWRISRWECLEGAGKAVPDLVAPDLRVLFVGINPSNCSGAAGFHFATPGNRFWPALHGAGFTDRRLRPDETDALRARGIGITNLVNHATARADEVDPIELRIGADDLRQTVRSLHWVGRADSLRETPAAVRFISAEPLLGPLDSLNLRGIDWLIVGGESGSSHRPMKLEWARDIRDRCQEVGTSFFFKQLGTSLAKAANSRDRKGVHPEDWPADLRLRQMP